MLKIEKNKTIKQQKIKFEKFLETLKLTVQKTLQTS